MTLTKEKPKQTECHNFHQERILVWKGSNVMNSFSSFLWAAIGGKDGASVSLDGLSVPVWDFTEFMFLKGPVSASQTGDIHLWRELKAGEALLVM